ncbi:MAG: hypothetical protein ACREOW_11430 [Thermodesulfobacteriota bacterium]
MLPAFNGIGDEARNVSRKALSAPVTEYDDHADIVEAAEQAGVSHYFLLDGIRQGMLNLFAVATYHAFEQQVMRFHRKELLVPNEENNPDFFNLTEIQKRLKNYKIDITTFSSWPRVDELRLVANTVKHADGKSAKELHSLRPNLFEHPLSQKYNVPAATLAPQVFQPLVGEDL